MDPLRLLPGAAPEAPEHAPTQPRDGAARWRQELERAQWALRTQRAAGASNAAASGGSAPAPAAMPRAPSPAAASRGDTSSSLSSGATQGRPGTAAAAASAPNLPPVPSAPPRPSFAAGAAPITRTSQQRGPAPAPAAQEAQPSPERFIWPRTHVHVLAHDGAAQVWVRDGTLDENERRRLAAQLAARLRASGVRLASLAVNGEQIYTLEGVTSWQSKQ